MAISKELSKVIEIPVPAYSQAPARGGLNRVASIDIFRGLTMVVMVFVNQLAEMSSVIRKRSFLSIGRYRTA